MLPVEAWSQLNVRPHYSPRILPLLLLSQDVTSLNLTVRPHHLSPIFQHPPPISHTLVRLKNSSGRVSPYVAVLSLTIKTPSPFTHSPPSPKNLPYLSPLEQLLLTRQQVLRLPSPSPQYGGLQRATVAESKGPRPLEALDGVDGVQVDGGLFFGLAAREECDAWNIDVFGLE